MITLAAGGRDTQVLHTPWLPRNLPPASPGATWATRARAFGRLRRNGEKGQR
jgi:hypothetical protein